MNFKNLSHSNQWSLKAMLKEDLVQKELEDHTDQDDKNKKDKLKSQENSHDSDRDNKKSKSLKRWRILSLEVVIDKLNIQDLKGLKKLNLATKLTVLRILLIPLYVLFAPWDIPILNVLAAFIFAVAAFTDFFDGYFARKFNQTSQKGAVLDHLSDKALLICAILVLSSKYIWYLPLFVIIVLREILVLGLREVSLTEGYVIKVGNLGKIKTVLLDIGIVGLTLGSLESSYFASAFSIGFMCLLAGCVVSLYSGWLYWLKFSSFSKKSKQQD